MSNLTHWKKLTNPDYIGAYSLQPGEEKTVEIVSVSKQKVKGTDGKEQDCIVAILKGEKPMVLNKTNCKTLAKIYDDPYIENWGGKKIIVFAAKVKAFGDVVDALRIKPEIPILPKLTKDSPKWAGAVKALKDGTCKIDDIEKKYTITKQDRETLLTESI